jgi:crotonobetainyl-CoA:carnitine CoA-transferase CaiB-like acyl-CoA transferase
MTNFRLSTMQRWELGPDDLRSEHNDLVVLAVTGYGLTGPYRDRGSFDRIASAYSGHTYVSAEAGRVPVRAGCAVINYMSAYLGAFVVLVALRHLDGGGGGQVIDLALFEAGFRATESSYKSYAVIGSVRQPSGNRNPLVVPATESMTVD